MAKKEKRVGITITGHIVQRSIVFDEAGVPWIIDPARGEVSLAKLITTPQSAVKK